MEERQTIDRMAELSHTIKGMVELLNDKIKEAEELGLTVDVVSYTGKKGQMIKPPDNSMEVTINQVIAF